MKPQDLIRKKRDGRRFTPEEINSFIRGVCDGSWADYQVSALVMACFINGLRLSEQNALVEAMLNSGERMDFSDLDRPVADKHSTGGVGDKTSLLIAPLAAACGLAVPMISGRGLGHTGGTLDKLESIAGYKVSLSAREFKRIVKKCGFAMAGQTSNIVPADKKLYALRDATATIESIPLIVASIMSKKLAEDLDALILDVKTEALLTDMNQPLGKFVGNALEVYECVKLLRGEIEEQARSTLELSVELTARMLVLAKIEKSVKAAREKIQNALTSGAGLEKFRENIRLQGGDVEICDKPEILLDADLIQVKVKSPDSGYIDDIDATEIGRAVSTIGGGRMKISDKIDPAVGYACERRLGERVRQHEPLGTLYCRNEAQAALILARLQMAYKISGEKPVRKFELIKEVI